MLKTWLILIFVFALATAQALPVKKNGKNAVVSRHLKIDSSKISVKQFDTLAINKYRASPPFKYAEVKTGTTWWDRFWAWVWRQWVNFMQWLRKLVGGGKGSGQNTAPAMRYVIIGIAAIVLVIGIFKLIGISLRKIKKGKKNTVEVPYSESLENIHEINFDQTIENAIAAKNYRLAVRLLYLRSLKQLSDRNLINWKLDKTNSAYLNELVDAEQKRRFSVLTRQFEYVWYGDFPLDGQSFQDINIVFQEFKKQIA